MRLDESTVTLITGASSGIGRALARALAAHRVRMGLLARRSELLGEVVQECTDLGATAVGLSVDVTVRAQVNLAIERTVRELGPISILVNNAGRGHNAYVEDTSDEQLESMFRVNALSLWHTTSAVLPSMRGQDSGLIVNISSIAGKVGYPGNAAYVAAKHAVVGFTRALRAELAGTGVQAMVVIPAGVATDWAASAEGGSLLQIFEAEHRRGAEIARERSIDIVEGPPLQKPEEVAEAIVAGILDPVPELYTHPQAREMALLEENDPAAFDAAQEPFRRANREAYSAGRRA